MRKSGLFVIRCEEEWALNGERKKAIAHSASLLYCLVPGGSSTVILCRGTLAPEISTSHSSSSQLSISVSVAVLPGRVAVRDLGWSARGEGRMLIER